MKTLLCIVAIPLVTSPTQAQSSAALAADLQAVDAAHWPAVNALLVAQRNELTAVHVASLAGAASDFTSQLTASTTARDDAVAKLNALQDQISSVLSSTLTDLQPQLTAAQAALTAELTTGDGPQAAAQRLIVTDLQARVDTLNVLIAEAGKSDKQKALEAAQSAKDAADKALLDAQAALQQP